MLSKAQIGSVFRLFCRKKTPDFPLPKGKKKGIFKRLSDGIIRPNLPKKAYENSVLNAVQKRIEL